jgi:hypothetical protein
VGKRTPAPLEDLEKTMDGPKVGGANMRFLYGSLRPFDLDSRLTYLQGYFNDMRATALSAFGRARRIGR